VQNATFVSSADRKATRSADELGIVLGRFSFLRAKLCAGSPGVIAVIIVTTLTVGQYCSHADEPVKLALASPTSVSTTISTTNTTKVVRQTSSPTTNLFSASFEHQPATPGLTTPPLGLANGTTDSTRVVLTRKPRVDSGLFSTQPGNGNFGFANFEAGYGPVYDCDSIVLRGRNGTTYEETRYIFVKKVVKF